MHTDPSDLLPFVHTYDPAIKKLTVTGLSEFPHEILQLADQIEILDLSHGHLTKLPDEFATLNKLQVVFLADNDFTEVPAILAQCPMLKTIGMVSCNISVITDLPAQLEALILTNNQLTEIPSTIGNITSLKKLTLTGNHLTQLPRDLLRCTNLELIRIAANKFSVLPNWLLALPKLAWYTDAGNPGSPTPVVARDTTIYWHDLVLQEKLGESSKNTVYAATTKRDNTKIAVKIFGGHISADGNPNDEMTACLSVPVHPALVQTIAEVIGAPDKKKALAMGYIPSDHKDLGNPPTLSTVVRDTYPADRRFSQAFIVSVMGKIASALEHLHGAGLMHGDVYAHNILVSDTGNTFLTDLGAASFYIQTPENAHEYVETQAYGRLLEEMLSRRISTKEDSASAYTILETMAAKCLLPVPSDRLTFREIVAVFSTL